MNDFTLTLNRANFSALKAAFECTAAKSKRPGSKPIHPALLAVHIELLDGGKTFRAVGTDSHVIYWSDTPYKAAGPIGAQAAAGAAYMRAAGYDVESCVKSAAAHCLEGAAVDLLQAFVRQLPKSAEFCLIRRVGAVLTACGYEVSGKKIKGFSVGGVFEFDPVDYVGYSRVIEPAARDFRDESAGQAVTIALSAKVIGKFSAVTKALAVAVSPSCRSDFDAVGRIKLLPGGRFMAEMIAPNDRERSDYFLAMGCHI